MLADLLHPPQAILALADGTVFRGQSIGATGQTVGEVVFNTALTGYQEILTDPSYCKQIVTLIGSNTGLLETTLANLQKDQPGLESSPLLAETRAQARGNRQAEFHVSVAQLIAMLAPPADPNAPPPETPAADDAHAKPAVTSLGIAITPSQISVEVFLPYVDVKAIAKGRLWW